MIPISARSRNFFGSRRMRPITAYNSRTSRCLRLLVSTVGCLPLRAASSQILYFHAQQEMKSCELFHCYNFHRDFFPVKQRSGTASFYIKHFEGVFGDGTAWIFFKVDVSTVIFSLPLTRGGFTVKTSASALTGSKLGVAFIIATRLKYFLEYSVQPVAVF